MVMVTLLHRSNFQVLHSVSPFSIKYDTQQFTTNCQCKPKISKLWATVARTWSPPRWLWRVLNVYPASVPRTRAVISRWATVPPAPPGNNPVNRPTSSSSMPAPRHPSGTPGRAPNSLPMIQFLLCTGPWKTDVAKIVDLPPLPDIINNR
jgi:hypothetical protein